MRKTLFIALITLIVFSTVAARPGLISPVQAAGVLTTSGDSQPGQVRTYSKDGVMYLTTDTTAGASSSAYSTYGNLSLSRTPFVLPEGFARDFGTLLNGVLSFVMVLSALLVFFYLVSGAFDWIMSGGDKGQTDKARNKITAAIIGIVIVAASYAILTLVLRFLGFTSINDVLNNARTINGYPEPTPVVSPLPSASPIIIK